MVVGQDDAENTVKIMNNNNLGKESNIIGEVVIDILEQSMKVRDMKTAIEEARENR